MSLLRSSWVFGAILIAWEGLTRLGVLDPLFFPPPTTLAQTLVALAATGDLTHEVGTTLGRTLLGFGAGLASCVVAFLIVGLVPSIGAGVEPVVAALYSAPRLTLLPMVMVVLGVNDTSRVFVVGVAVFLSLTLQVADAVRGVNPDFVHMAVNYGASRAMVLRRVYVPACLPRIFTAIRIAFGRALVLTISVELLSSQDGLGSLIWSAWQTFAVERLYAGVLLAAAMGLVSQAGFRVLERRLVPWKAHDS